MMHLQVVSILFIISSVSGQQSFNQQPQDTTVIEGATTTLICLVNNLQGEIYWLKGAVILGSTDNRQLPTYPRYQITDEISGGNLRIENAQIEDDDDYTCQVSAAVNNPQLVSNIAHLTVQVAPDDPVISSYPNGSKVTVLPPNTVSLTCVANNAQPKANISWFEDNDPAVAVPVVVITDADNKKKNVASTITLQPTKAQNGVEMKCMVEHPALQGYSPFTTVTLDVQYAPNEPQISGYEPGTFLRKGEEKTFTCFSRGGNPQPDVFWYKNGELFDSSYTTGGNMAQNELVYTVGYGDHNLELECRVISVVLATPYSTTITLTVLYAAAYVNVTGNENLVRTGDSVLLTCTSAPSNPASTISWISQGVVLKTDDDVVKELTGGGFITSQNLTISNIASTESIQYICQATNGQLFEQTQTTVSVNVMYPPDPPFISGYQGAKVKAGSIMSLTCVSVGGNPLADLKWYKGTQELVGSHETSNRLVNSKLTWILSQEDNQAVYSCNASNSATRVPLHSSTTLNVLFPPSSVNVTIMNTEMIKEGETVVIICRTASSNPISVITWYKDGTEIEGEDIANKSGENYGYITRNRLRLRKVGPEDNGKIFKCSALNELLTESVNDAVTLNVKYAPKMTVENGTTIRKTELFGQVRIECGAHGNPSEVTFKWLKNNVNIYLPNSRYYMEDSGTFVIRNATRTDAGVYKCRATNEVGSAYITATLKIEYPPKITTEQHIIVNLGMPGELRCDANANPKPAGFIKWSREGYDISSYRQEFINDGCVLKIPSVSKGDGGLYKCRADNGIGPATSKDVFVIVQYKPEIDTTGNGKVATSTGETALLKCRAQGAPVVKFKWKRLGKDLNTTTDRYTMDVSLLGLPDSYESRLVINLVDEVEDFGTYTCIAYNAIGESTFNIVVEKKSVPDAPTGLEVLSVTHNSVTLRWFAGFDGGLNQTYQIGFRRDDLNSFQFMDVEPPYDTTFTVTGLNPLSKYEFSVRGRNDLGYGQFILNSVEATTSPKPSQPPGFQKIGAAGVSLWIVLLVAFCGFLFCCFVNGFLCCCLIKRRKGHKLGKSSPEPIRKEDFELTKSQTSENPYQNGTISSYDRDSSKESDYDPYYYGDHRSYDDRRRDRDFSDGATYSEEDRYSDNRQISPTPTDCSEYNGGLYNTGYRAPPDRPPSYSSFDSYAGGRGGLTGSIITESQLSEIEEQEEKDYADLLRMKQSQVQKTLSGQVRQVSTPTPPPIQMGNFVPLTKAQQPSHSRHRDAISEEGFLV